MPRLPSLLPLLRPLAAPRAVACRQHARFSTPSSELPPTPSTPHEAQRAAGLAAAESLTEGDSAQPPQPKPTLPSKHPRADNKPTQKPKTSRAPKLSLPPPKYAVSRSANKNLPIYTDYKRGGNLHLTTVRKITGDISALRDELRVFLNKKNEDVKINSVTQHVIVKGHHSGEIAEFLKARGM
ncbi:mitochondrial 54S ribosomal protein mL49 [Alternaria dauci]|uniref:Large ribosomal subunit protein mL49 n=1 Tax=Alternaria dauci TaxID=48095 RepID=A0ABR3UVA7_9PLEO